MNTTIYEATKESPVLAILGHNQTIEICPTVYLFRRPKFANGMAQTLPNFAQGIQCVKESGKWIQIRHSIIREWNEKITVIEKCLND